MSSKASARALITGITGQDGSYLAELLVAEGVEVHGTVRSARGVRAANLAALADAVTLHEADLLERGSLRALVAELEPTEIYHLAAPGFVPESWSAPAVTMSAIVGATTELIEAVRDHVRDAHLVLASSREIFGAHGPSPQDETTHCAPSSPYGVAKLAAQQLVGVMRQRDELHLSSAILYNHESPRRQPNFITRKVTRAAAAISLGMSDELILGDLDAVRDWSAAEDIVLGLRAMATATEPSDFVLASGVGRSVNTLVDVAFACVELDPKQYVRVDPELVRAREASDPIGNPARARTLLGWTPRISFEQLISGMVAADLEDLGEQS